MIKIYTCGGTIDKIYYDEKDEYGVGDPIVPHLLKTANLDIEYDVEKIIQKDSLHITSTDLDLIVETIKTCEHEKILVTHGTDTMKYTASFLIANGISKSKRVVFTGSMSPARFHESDALFNIAFALGYLEANDECGVFIAMHGKIFDPFRVEKDRVLNKFFHKH